MRPRSNTPLLPKCGVGMVVVVVVIIGLCFGRPFAAAAATSAAAPSTSIGSGRWSDPAVWQAGRVPAAGESVVIASGTTVQLDTNVSATSIAISGPGAVLTCMRNRDLPSAIDAALDVTVALVVEKGGCFSCGAGDCLGESEQYAGRLTIRLGRSSGGGDGALGPPPATADDDVRTLLVRDGGALYLSGSVRAPAITRLAAHARPGDSSIVVSDSAAGDAWQIGDLIAIAPTDYAPSQTEFRRVVGVSRSSASLTAPTRRSAAAQALDAAVAAETSGIAPATATLQLDKPLVYVHNGRRLDLPGSPNGAGNFVIDARAEVALLSRNIVVEGVPDEPAGLGGDVKVVGRTSRLSAKWAEFRFLGRRGQMGRYPVHLHGAAEGPVVADVSVHDSYQRGVVLHCTNGAQVSDTVVAAVPGFAFMLEDGAEENNSFTGNLVMDVLNAIQGTASVETEHGSPAAFWFVNPANSFVGNMAAGVRGVSYSWEMLKNRTASYTLCPQDVPGYDVDLFRQRKFAQLDDSVYGALMRRNFVEFRNNTAHSAHSGIWFRNGVMGTVTSRAAYPPKQSVIGGFTAYNLAPRLTAPPGVDGSHHDSCVHVSGISRLRLTRMACINSPRVYWSSDSNVLDDTLMAWIASGENGASDDGPLLLSDGQQADGDKWRYPQGLISYSTPPTFVNTHVRGTYGRAVFLAMGLGSAAAASGAVVRGFSYDAATLLRNFDLVMVLSQAPHLFVDEDGGWLGAGAGARVLASCFGCGTNPDPVIEAYAPGACLPVGTPTTKAGAKVPAEVEYVSQPRPSAGGGGLRGMGATPLLCAGPDAPRFAAVRISVEAAGGQQQPPSIDFGLFAGRTYLRQATQTRDANAAFFLAPLTRAVMSAFGGYRVSSPTAWSGLRWLVVALGPVAEADLAEGGGGMTIVLTGVPMTSIGGKPLRYSSLRAESVVAANGGVGRYGDVRMVGGNASDASSCATLVATACTSGGAPCVCRDQTTGDLYVRLVASRNAVDPAMYDSRGELYMYQAEALQLIWDGDVRNAAAAAATAAKTAADFDQLTKYMTGR